MSEKYYDISNLLQTNAQYMMMLGQRANGKSYQAKKTVLENFVKTGHKFVYLRRWKEDIKTVAVEAYFDDMDIYKITKGKWTSLKAWRNAIYFTRLDDKGKEEKIEIGRYAALNEAERYKSWIYKDYDFIIYEEFITDKSYLVNEPTILQHYISTVLRNNEGHVLLVGNTLSRVCPYFNEWCLEGTLKQKQGTIEIYHYHDFDGETIDVAVEYCANANFKNKMFFGQAGKQIVSGEWEVKNVHKLPKEISEYETVYELLFVYQSFKFVVQLLVEPNEGGRFVYVYPFTGKRKIYRIISDEFSDKPNITSKLDLNKKPEMIIADCFRLDKICYSDNLTGSDFNHVLENFAIK